MSQQETGDGGWGGGGGGGGWRGETDVFTQSVSREGSDVIPNRCFCSELTCRMCLLWTFLTMSYNFCGISAPLSPQAPSDPDPDPADDEV